MEDRNSDSPDSKECTSAKGLRRKEESFSPGYTRIFESNRYHIVNNKGKKHRHEMAIELNDKLTMASSFRQPPVDYKSYNFNRSIERPPINKDDLINHRPHDNRFKIVKNSTVNNKKYIKNIALSKGPRRSFRFREVAMYSRGDHQPFFRDDPKPTSAEPCDTSNRALLKGNFLRSTRDKARDDELGYK